jgi:hypothetical protein
MNDEGAFGRTSHRSQVTTSTVLRPRAIMALTAGVLAMAASRSDAQEYRGKLTVGAYSTDEQVTTDINVRYSSHDWTGWVGWYGPQSEVRQSRAGFEYDLKRPRLVLVPSVQVASGSFVGGSVYSEIGKTIYLIAGASRTNLKPYANLTFDPNESWQLGAGVHFGMADSIAAYAIWDNRLDTGQQNSHVLLRHYLPHARRLTVDVSYKSGHDDEGQFIRGSGQAMEYDWHRWFTKAARDARANFSTSTMWRVGGGLRF